jgi:hypothetical protein
MKRILQLSFLFAFALSYGQRTLPLYEGFDYDLGSALLTNGTATGQGGWTHLIPSTGTLATGDAAIVSSPGWASNGLPAYAGEALDINKAGDDPQLVFTPVPTTGAMYASFVVKVTSLMTGTVATPSYITYATTGTSTSTPVAPAYFFSFGFVASGGVTTSYAGAVFIRRSSSTATDTFYLGINAGSATAAEADITWSPTLFTIGEEIVVVTRYSYDDYVAKMWLNPTITATEPINPLVTPARPSSSKPDRLRITQLSAGATPFIIIDEIRAATNWIQATGGTLGLSNSEIAELKVYPNPVSNGTLYISSADNNEKQVAIYTILGQQVLQTKTTSGSINVSSLAKGGYLLKITEDGKSETKKLIVE